MRILGFAASVVGLVLIARTCTPDEAAARGGFRAGGVRHGGHHFHGALRYRGWQRAYPLRYGVVVSGGGVAVTDSPPVSLTINNQPPGDGFDRALRRVCRAEPFTVPSESGGVRDITVTRCFRE